MVSSFSNSRGVRRAKPGSRVQRRVARGTRLFPRSGERKIFPGSILKRTRIQNSRCHKGILQKSRANGGTCQRTKTYGCCWPVETEPGCRFATHHPFCIGPAFERGVFYADPHPCNLFIAEDGTLSI